MLVVGGDNRLTPEGEMWVRRLWKLAERTYDSSGVGAVVA